MSLMIRRLGSSKMEDTDNKWSRVIVYNALIGHVDAVRIIHSTWPSTLLALSEESGREIKSTSCIWKTSPGLVVDRQVN
jgi:hypothetical protein